MFTGKRSNWISVAAGLLALAAVDSADAQNGRQGGTAPPDDNPNRVIISRGSSIAEAAAAWGAAAGATVVVDPVLNGRVSGATARLSLEPGLTAVAQQYRAKWRKVYLDERQLPRSADGKVDARKLKAIVEAAQAVPAQTVGIVDPATGLMTVTTRAAETEPAMQAWAKGRKPVYLLYMPGPEPGTPGAPGTPGMGPGGMGPRGAEDFRNMTPEQRKKWMDEHNGVIITSTMSPEEREAALNRLPPEERERMKLRLQEGGDQVMVFRREERHEP